MQLSSLLVTAFAVLSSTSINGGSGGGVATAEQEQQCGNGVCSWHNEECGLYMAESTVPNAGWGVFTGRDRKENDEEYVEPMDLSITVPDYDYQMGFDRKDETMPEWMLKDYHWTGLLTQTMHEADHVYMITPGLGMLANSLTSLYNLRNDGCLLRERVSRNDTSAGSFTHCQELGFMPMYDLQAGDELFVEYGEHWFKEREEELGPLPMWNDYEQVDNIVKRWEGLTDDPTSELAGDIWDMMVTPLSPLMKDRILSALPLTHEDAFKALKDPFGSAGTSVPNRSHSLEYLQEHGMCLDHIETKQSKLVPFQHGAFAAHKLKKGQIVAPVPLVQLSRRHLEVNVPDPSGEEIWWTGKQLLWNYAYGHKDSSLLLFPYSPGVNLINHAGGSIKTKDGNRPTPNVALRWSKRMKSELLKESVVELLKKEKTGLLMELVALRAIKKGEELLLDYSQDFEDAYQRHVDRWEPPVHAEDYKSSWDFEVADEIYTVDEIDKYPASYITVRCWVDVQQLKEQDDEGWYEWVKMDNNYLDSTLPCTAHSADYDDNGEKQSYRIIVETEEKKIKVKNAQWAAITFTEKEYTGNQFLRQAFRHEIRLPDDVFPDAWKDLKTADSERCGLYMAESAIPKSGMGMYTAKPIKSLDRIYSGDLVVQVEDYDENNRLRRIYQNSSAKSEDETWLLEQYYWNPSITVGQFEATQTQSIVPGLGMLANSHSGLVNAEIQAPTLSQTSLHRGKDPGAGSSTNYHDVHFWTPQDIVAGEEIFVKYGDGWFAERTDLGMIPLEHDFVYADSLVNHFHHITSRKNLKSDDLLARDIWGLIETASASRERLVAALPKDVSEVEQVVKMGTAKYSTPDRIRSIEWLEKNGKCLDNLRPDDSTIPQAGKGAFATRTIKKGDVIAPLPVVQILRRDLEIYEEIRYPGQRDPVINYLGVQQLQNYCYGSPVSTMLLFPYSPVVNYVNHNKAPNAKLQWSSLSRKDWLNRSPVELARESHAGLVMEIVALRDIKAEEEVTLDYGDDWDRAWREFNLDWFPGDDSISYTPASALNRRVEWLRTEKELVHEPYPDNVMTVCFVGMPRPNATSRGGETTPINWEYYEGVYHDAEFSFPCDILEREESNDFDFDYAYDRKDSINPADIRYSARLDQKDGPLFFSNIPRQAIRFFDVPYSSDLFLRTSFRHEIGLPDDMIPDAWRDVRKD